MAGLEDVIAFDTNLSFIDGKQGCLAIRGRDIGAFSALGFERACGLLWLDDDSAERGEDLRLRLGRARECTHAKMGTWLAALERGTAMAGLRAALACLDVTGTSVDAATTTTAALGVLLAAWRRREEGLALLEPDPDASHAADVWRLMTGTTHEPRATALETYLCTVMEHGVNASTFAARTVASTDADLASAVIAGMCALEGRLHGGAPGPVLDMLDAIGSELRAPEWLAGELDAKRRIMGMGHRVYRARDPRAAVLEAACRELTTSPRIELARSVEREAERMLAKRHPDRRLRANVEFFTAVLLESIGIPRTMFTATFAAGRVAGWCAHIEEQRRTGRLIRPRARYIGRAPVALHNS